MAENAFKRQDTGLVGKNIGRVLDAAGIDNEWNSDIPYSTAASNSMTGALNFFGSLLPFDAEKTGETFRDARGQVRPRINIKPKVPEAIKAWSDAADRTRSGQYHNTDPLLVVSPAFGTGSIGAAIEGRLAGEAAAGAAVRAAEKPHAPEVNAFKEPEAPPFADYNRGRFAKSMAEGSASRAPEGAEFFYDHDAQHNQYSKRKALEDGADALFGDNGRTVASNDVTPLPQATAEPREALDPALFHRRFKQHPTNPNPDHVYNMERIGRRVADGVDPARLTMPLEEAYRPPGVRLSANADEKPAVLAAAEASGDGGNAFKAGGRGPRSQNDQTPFYGEHVGPKGQLIDDPQVLAERYGLKTGLPGQATNEGRFNPSTSALLQRGVQPRQTATYYRKQLQGRGAVPPGDILDSAMRDVGVSGPDHVINRDDLVRAIEQRSPRLATGRTMTGAERTAIDNEVQRLESEHTGARFDATVAHGDGPGEGWVKSNALMRERDALRAKRDATPSNKWDNYATKDGDGRKPQNYFETVIGYQNTPPRWFLNNEAEYGPYNGRALSDTQRYPDGRDTWDFEQADAAHRTAASKATYYINGYKTPQDAIAAAEADVARYRAELAKYPNGNRYAEEDLASAQKTLEITKRHAANVRDNWNGINYELGTPGIFRDGHFSADSRFESKQPERTNLEGWQRGQLTNVERAMTPEEANAFKDATHEYEGLWARSHEAEDAIRDWQAERGADWNKRIKEHHDQWTRRIAEAARNGASPADLADLRMQSRREIEAFNPRTPEERAKRRQLIEEANALERAAQAAPKPKPPTVNHFLVDEAQDQRRRMYEKNKGATPEQRRMAEAAQTASRSMLDREAQSMHEFIASPAFEQATRVIEDLSDGNPEFFEKFARTKGHYNNNKNRDFRDKYAADLLMDMQYILEGFGDMYEEGASVMKPFEDADALYRNYIQAKQIHADAQARFSSLSDGTPPSPYVHSKADSTHLLANEAVRDATRLDADAITWVPGDENALRMGIGTHIDHVQYDHTNHNLSYRPRGSAYIKTVPGSVTPDQLAEHVGPEIANKLLQRDQFGGHLTKVDIPEGQVVGGRGMNAFYGDERGLDRDGRQALYPGQLAKIISRLDPNANVVPRPVNMADQFLTKVNKEFPSIQLSEAAKRKALQIGLRLFSNADLSPALMAPAAASAENPNAFAR